MRVDIEVDYRIGDFVYHRCDNEGTKGIVTGYLIRSKAIVYWVTWGDSRTETGHFGFELTSEKPLEFSHD